MRAIACLMLMGLLTAQDLPIGRSQLPQPKIPFELTYFDIRSKIHSKVLEGKITVDFFINEYGDVENPIIKDTFNVELNEVVLDKVRQTKYKPALQNGKPVKVKYTLPIVFK